MLCSHISRDRIVNVTVVADYKTHADCLHAVEQSVDCLVAYPQALPVITFTANNAASYLPVPGAPNVADIAEMMRWGISAHL